MLILTKYFADWFLNMHIKHGLHIKIQNVLLPFPGFDLNLILHVSFGKGFLLEL